LVVAPSGGSTELNVYTRGKKIKSRSFKIGSVRMLEHKDSPVIWRELEKWIKEHVKAEFGKVTAVGTGGNISKLFDLANAAKKESIEQGLVDLVNIRASQINGCAFCLDMHVKEATMHGERALRLHHITIWRESTLFTARERLALEWTETLTTLPPGGVSEALFEKARAVFSEKELSDLTVLVGIINVWNRLNGAFHSEPGSMDAVLGIANSGLS